MKRKLAALLAFVLLLASVNVTAFADDEHGPTSGNYRLSYDNCFYEEAPHATVSVATGSNAPEAKAPNIENEFENGTEIRFKLESPEDKKDKIPYAEVIEYDKYGGSMNSRCSWDAGSGIALEGTGGIYTFSYTPSYFGEVEVDSFDVNIWWSEFDWFGQEPLEGSDPEVMCAYLELYVRDGSGQARMEGEEGVQSSIYSRYVEEEGKRRGEGDFKANINPDSRFKRLVFEPDENFEMDYICLRWENGSEEILYAEDLDQNENTYYYDLSGDDWDEKNRLCVEVFFTSAGGPSKKQGSLVNYIRKQQFAFGDWDKDGDADADDVAAGIRDQIFYSGDNYRDSKDYYGISAPEDIQLAVNKNSEETLRVVDRDGAEHSLPVYDYEVTLEPKEESEREKYTKRVSGKAYLFKFIEAIDSDYVAYSDTDLIMEAESGETTVRRLINARIKENSYTSPDVVDLKTGQSGEEAQEGTIALYAAYDVKKEESGNVRSVSVYGNGASLDTMFSRDEDTLFFTSQGRNENLVRDVNENRTEEEKLDQVFATFTFIQPGARSVEVNASGASGNTPAWAYGYSKFSSAASGAADALEVEAYFGNTEYTFRPVLFGSGVKRISNLQPVGDVPAAALVITNEEDGKLWTVRFNSDYYDEMTFRITYEMDDASTEDRYIKLHRVGIDIEETSINGDERREAEESGTETATITLMHGTTNGPSYEASLKAEKILYATYYYPEAADTTDYVDLYVTYTWKDGSVTRSRIENRADLNMERKKIGEEYNCQTSDFILYEGTKAKAPVKVEVIAIVGGSDEEEFKGAKIGAGKGVAYTLSTKD